MLRSELVDRLFARLTVRYGRAFTSQYDGLDEAAVKADWADLLGGFDSKPMALKYALDNLPERAPTAGQFLAIARRAPEPTVAQLPEPKADPERVAQAIKTAQQETKPRIWSPAQQAIDNIEAAVAKRGRLDPGQRHVLAHCLRMPGTSTTLDVRAAP